MISEESRVRHKKYGLGTVKSLYPQYNAARVEYDNGHVSTNALKRLTEVSEAVREVETLPQEEERTSRPRHRGGTTTVNYTELEQCRQHVMAEHPDADEVVSRIHGGRPYCEVWKDGGAKIVFCEVRA